MFNCDSTSPFPCLIVQSPAASYQLLHFFGYRGHLQHPTSKRHAAMLETWVSTLMKVVAVVWSTLHYPTAKEKLWHLRPSATSPKHPTARIKKPSPSTTRSRMSAGSRLAWGVSYWPLGTEEHPELTSHDIQCSIAHSYQILEMPWSQTSIAKLQKEYHLPWLPTSLCQMQRHPRFPGSREWNTDPSCYGMVQKLWAGVCYVPIL